MTLEEAIKHCEEVAEAEEQKYKDWKGDYSHLKKIDSCLECAKEHRQLAEWLKKLKAYEEAREEIIRKRDSGHMERICSHGLNHAIYIIDKHLMEVNADDT